MVVEVEVVYLGLRLFLFQEQVRLVLITLVVEVVGVLLQILQVQEQQVVKVDQE
jgi:hypothetical protein